MNDLFPQFAAADWPAGADQQCVARERERFLAAARDENSDIAGFAEALTASRAGARLLEAIFGNSPYLSGCLTQDPGFAATVLRDGPDATFTGLRDALVRARTDPTGDTRSLMSTLRMAEAPRGPSRRAGRYCRAVAAGARHRRVERFRRSGHRRRRRPSAARGRGCRRLSPARHGRSMPQLRLHHHRHGQARRARAQLFERCRPDRALRSRVAFDRCARCAAEGLRPAGALAGQDPRRAHRGRLRLAHRPPPAPRSGGDAAGDLHRGGRALLRKPRPELGARGDDQGAAGGRRPRGRRAVPPPV